MRDPGLTLHCLQILTWRPGKEQWAGKTRQEPGRVGRRKGRTQLTFISRRKVFLKIKARIRSYLLPGDPEGRPFMANMTSSGYFSPVREKSDLLASDGEKEAYVPNWLCQQESTKVEGSGF